MPKHNKDMYDAVIIGAGIGGLVCGCYLAKAGMKVLIVEQHHKPGGYCTSFKRKGFTFDAAAHSFGGYKYGIVGKVFKDLGIEKKIKLTRFDPSDIVITPDHKVSFWADLEKTIREFQEAFPKEKTNVKKFFNFLFSPNPNTFSKTRSWTFEQLLNRFLTDTTLKAILSFPLFGNGGLPPSMMSAFIGAKIFKEFLLDGGYHPQGCMQDLANALSAKFSEFGGTLILSCAAKKIVVQKRRVTGVVLDGDRTIQSKYVISNCDARQTFFNLLGREMVPSAFLETLENMIPSLSIFILYLGIDKALPNLPEPGINTWYLSHYNLDEAFHVASDGDFDNIGGYLIHVMPNNRSIQVFMNIAHKNKDYWLHNKNKAVKSFIKRIETEAIPQLSKHIVFIDSATPHTLQRYTLNYKGAAYGWAAIPSQIAISDFRKPSFLDGLYLSGHWTTQGLGIPGVIYVGYDTFKKIARKEKIIYS